MKKETYERIVALLRPTEGLAITKSSEFEKEGIAGELLRVASSNVTAVYVFHYNEKEYLMSEKDSVALFCSVNRRIVRDEDLPEILTTFLVLESSVVLGISDWPRDEKSLQRWLKGSEKDGAELARWFSESPMFKKNPDGRWNTRYRIMTWKGSVLEVVARGKDSPFSIEEFRQKELRQPGTYSLPFLRAGRTGK